MLLLGSLLWTTSNGGIIPPPPPPPADTGVRPSGGIPATLRVKGRTRKDVAEARQHFGIPDAAADAIALVAERQVESLEMDARIRDEELREELALREMEYNTRYLEVLNEMRVRLIDEEIAARLRLAMREDEDLMTLMMMAAAVA